MGRRWVSCFNPTHKISDNQLNLARKQYQYYEYELGNDQITIWFLLFSITQFNSQYIFKSSNNRLFISYSIFSPEIYDSDDSLKNLNPV
ncbi:MAG: hypothetical protein ACKO2T_18540, partial [Microcystis aeruginosa]